MGKWTKIRNLFNEWEGLGIKGLDIFPQVDNPKLVSSSWSSKPEYVNIHEQFVTDVSRTETLPTTKDFASPVRQPFLSTYIPPRLLPVQPYVPVLTLGSPWLVLDTVKSNEGWRYFTLLRTFSSTVRSSFSICMWVDSSISLVST